MEIKYFSLLLATSMYAAASYSTQGPILTVEPSASKNFNSVFTSDSLTVQRDLLATMQHLITLGPDADRSVTKSIIAQAKIALAKRKVQTRLSFLLQTSRYELKQGYHQKKLSK